MINYFLTKYVWKKDYSKKPKIDILIEVICLFMISVLFTFALLYWLASGGWL